MALNDEYDFVSLHKKWTNKYFAIFICELNVLAPNFKRNKIADVYIPPNINASI